MLSRCSRNISAGSSARTWKRRILNSYRLSRIYRDLIATDLPVGTLAEKHGFTNDKLFHRLFRERFHTTPLQLRKAAREKGS